MKALKLSKGISTILALLLCLALLFSSCVKNPKEEATSEIQTEKSEQVMPEGVLTVPYTSLDTVNPFLCDSLLNSSIVSLVYRSLYVLDGGFNPVRDMAVNETISGETVRVEIAESLVFSDASPITAQDIVYSFNLAKKSPVWGEGLSEVKSCTVEGTYTVVFTFSEKDINGLNVLTFPIAKEGTAEGEDALPIGSGYYIFTKDELRLSLTCNMKYAGDLPKIGTVRFYDITDSSSLMHLLDTGMIDCFYSDLSEGTAKRTYSSVNEVYLNNLIFLGVNSDSYRLSSADVRKAISKAVDRSALAENALLNHARAAYIPFNMSWTAITDSTYITVDTDDSDIHTADALLDGVGCGIEGSKISLELICSETNSFMKNTATLIADELELVNIKVNISLLSEKDLKTALSEGEYDLYLGEIKLCKNMDLSTFFSAKGEANYGIDLENSTVDDSYYEYKSGEITLEDFLKVFEESMPFIPLLYRNGQFCYSRSIEGITDVTENDLYSSIANWTLLPVTD